MSKPNSNDRKTAINWSTLFTQSDIEEVFAPRGVGVSAETCWNSIGRPKGPANVLLVATSAPPKSYKTPQDAQADNAPPGRRTGYWLCVAIIAKAAYESGVRRDDGSWNGKLHKMWRESPLFEEFAKLCLLE